MKRFIKKYAPLGALATLTIIGVTSMLLCAYTEKHYNRYCTVSEITDTEIVFVDDYGNANEWVIYKDSNEFVLGEKVILNMNSMGTETIYDDEVCQVIRR